MHSCSHLSTQVLMAHWLTSAAELPCHSATRQGPCWAGCNERQLLGPACAGLPDAMPVDAGSRWMELWRQRKAWSSHRKLQRPSACTQPPAGRYWRCARTCRSWGDPNSRPCSSGRPSMILKHVSRCLHSSPCCSVCLSSLRPCYSMRWPGSIPAACKSKTAHRQQCLEHLRVPSCSAPVLSCIAEAGQLLPCC